MNFGNRNHPVCGRIIMIITDDGQIYEVPNDLKDENILYTIKIYCLMINRYIY